MSVILYEPGLFEILDSPFGFTGRITLEKSEAVANIARQNVLANFTQRTGTLYDSIGVFPQETASGVAYEIGTDGAPYGRILELGGEPHDIYRVRAPFLFSEPNNPNPLIFDPVSVHHPGPQAKPWLVPAMETVKNGG